MQMTDPYTALEPREVWRHFSELNRIPRPSGKEAAARAYVENVAAAAGASSQADERGNLVVRVPATPGRESALPVAIQSHLDMVCEKRPEVAHDFDTDPIRPRLDGDIVSATGTTLGADNGIGAAYALALLTEEGLEHGPLELLFTVEEETGLHGAMALNPDLLRSRFLLNLDSEDPRELTVGCAGGAGATLDLPVTWEAAPAGGQGVEVVVSGLKGGHSGVQIHERLANAIKLLTGALLGVREAGVEFALAEVKGGNARNAIPRDASARLVVAPDAVGTLQSVVARLKGALQTEWEKAEPGLALDVRETSHPERVMGAPDAGHLLALLDALPHGVLAMSEDFAGKVETSSNLAQVATGPSSVQIASSIRSFVSEKLQEVQNRIRDMGLAQTAVVELRAGYPGWKPDAGSELLKKTVQVYRNVMGREPEVQVIHAGLECGVIVSKLPGMEAISFGPKIEAPHTPEERIYASTVAEIWQLLVALLDDLSATGGEVSPGNAR